MMNKNIVRFVHKVYFRYLLWYFVRVLNLELRRKGFAPYVRSSWKSWSREQVESMNEVIHFYSDSAAGFSYKALDAYSWYCIVRRYPCLFRD